MARAAQWAGGSIFQLRLTQLSNVRVISLYDQRSPQRLLCLGICQPFLGSRKIKPTWFLPSDSSQLLAKESSTRTKRALSLRASRVIEVLRREGRWIPKEEKPGVAAKPSRAWGRSAGQGAGDMTDAPINTRFGAWGLCLGLGRRGHGRQEEQGGRSGLRGAAPRAAGAEGEDREAGWPSRASGRTSQAEAWSKTPRAARKEARF